MEARGALGQTTLMAKVKTRFKPPRPRYFFKEWRLHRKHTQEVLAGMIGQTPSSISQLESGKQGFTDETLRLWARGLGCNPGDLLMRNPLDEAAPWSIWDDLEPVHQKQAMRIIETFPRKSGARK